jgi:DNA polymerase I-like protein with 3'-5' exonuclease and polymerase domains
VLAFFNGALGLPVEYEIRKTPQGHIKTPSANDSALRKWAKARMRGPGINPRDRTVHPVALAQPFVSLILTLRDCDKQLAILRTPLDPDGRMRCSYNVAGTKWDRWSSSKNPFGRGTNLQNVSPTMRRMFCADDGWRLVSTDLERAESYVVAGMVWQVTGDRAYLDANLSSDLHVQVCRMAWPEMPWNGDPTHDLALAQTPYPNLGGVLTYRDVAKRLGHGSNYGGSAYGISQAVGIPVWVVAEFQVRYFNAFPAIRTWHKWVREQLLAFQFLDTPLGRRNYFFDRPNEDSTVREAIAFVPQATVAKVLNQILYRCWERSLLWKGLPTDDQCALPIQLLLQNHDAFLFQTPETVSLPYIIEQVNSEFQATKIPFTHAGERLDLTIPGEFVTGWNWAKTDDDKLHFSDGNPDGLSKWKGSDRRVRVQGAAVAPGDWLSGPLPRIY